MEFEMVDHVILSDDDTASLDSNNDQSNILTVGDGEDCNFLGFNCPEKITFILDTSVGMARNSFGIQKKREISNMELAKKSIEMFVKTKNMLNLKHEFSLAIIQDNTPYMLQDWTNDVSVMSSVINDVQPSEETDLDHGEGKTFLDPIVEFVVKNICGTEHQREPPIPNNTFRMIYVSAQKHFDMTQESFESWVALHRCNTFFFDTVLVRDDEIVPGDEKCFEKLNVRKQNYILTVSEAPAEFFNELAKLLKHPMQRLTQKQLTTT